MTDLGEWGEVDELTAETPNADDATDAAPEAPELFYGSVEQFVNEKLAHQFKRRVTARSGGNIWARDWWNFPEAVSRLEALWRAWEHLRLDPALGMSVWWRDHADHHMNILFSEHGPFAGADTLGENKAGEPLPCDPAPEGWFPDLRSAEHHG
jgi:hypothetical protein